MWQLHYLRALELADDRRREAELERRAHLARMSGLDRLPSPFRPWRDAVRRAGSILLGGIAERVSGDVLGPHRTRTGTRPPLVG